MNVILRCKLEVGKMIVHRELLVRGGLFATSNVVLQIGTCVRWVLQPVLYVLFYITLTSPVSGQNALLVSDIAWGSDECFLRAQGQDQAFHECFFSGASVTHYPDGHFQLIKPIQSSLKLSTLHGQLGVDEAFPEAMFSSFVKSARLCEADVNCQLPQEVSTFWGGDGKCVGRVISYDLFHFFESGDIYIKTGSAGSVTVCSSEKAGLWIYQWAGVLKSPLGVNDSITYIIDQR